MRMFGNSHKLPISLLFCCLICLTAGSSNHEKYAAAKKFLERNQLNKALLEADRLLETNPKDPTALCLQAQALSGLGRRTEALRALNDVLKNNPKLAEAHFQKGRILNALGDQQGGLAEIQTALRLKPDWSEARNSSAVIKFQSGDSEGAISDLSTVIKSDPRFAGAWANRGAIYFRLGHLERAERDLNQALLLEPNEPETLNNRGRTLHAMKRFEAAINDFDKAIKLAPKKSDWYNNKGLSLVGMKQYEEALTWYTKAAELSPGKAAAFGNRGAALVRLKRLKEAEIDLRHALQLDPKYAPAHNSLAALYSLKGNNATAKVESDKALALEPDSTAYHSNRAHILAKQGKLEESLYDFESAKKNGQEQGDAKPVSKSDFQSLIATYDRVLRLHPDDKEAYYNRAFTYFCMKNMRPALKDIDTFLRLSTPDSKGALNAAIIANFVHRHEGHAESKKELDSVLKNTPASLKNYWGWSLASYLDGKGSKETIQSLKLNKTSKTQLKCYYAIDRSLVGDLDGAKKEFNWIRDFGDRDIDEFDLAMSWFQPEPKTRN